MTTPKRIAIILPSFNDARIADAIASVRRFDDIDTVQLVIIDGGSRPEVVDILRGAVQPGDILVSEADGGIFDALNKGLDRVETEYMGWLGSDDLFTGQIKASDVVAALEAHDLFVTGLAIFQDDRLRRITSAWPSGRRLARFGLHNPHYATFGRSVLFCGQRFRTDLKGSDIEYFLRIFAQRPRVATNARIGTLQREGGFSTSSYGKIWAINRELFGVYRSAGTAASAAIALPVKLGYKVAGSIRLQLFKQYVAQTLN